MKLIDKGFGKKKYIEVLTGEQSKVIGSYRRIYVDSHRIAFTIGNSWWKCHICGIENWGNEESHYQGIHNYLGLQYHTDYLLEPLNLSQQKIRKVKYDN